MPPPSQLEVVVFWVIGIVVTILSGGVAIYASSSLGLNDALAIAEGAARSARSVHLAFIC